MLLALTLLLLGNLWHLSWTPHELNKELQIVYQCPKDAQHPHFLAVNQWDIEIYDSQATVRKVPTPQGQKCQVIASIIQGMDASEWTSEQAITDQEDH